MNSKPKTDRSVCFYHNKEYSSFIGLEEGACTVWGSNKSYLLVIKDIGDEISTGNNY